MLTVTLKWAKTNFLFKIFKGCTWNKICVFSLFKSKNIRETWRKVSANFQKKASVIFWKWKLCRLCSARMQPKLSSFLIRTPKNIPDQQKCVGFHKLKKVLNHSTLLPEYYSYSMYCLADLFQGWRSARKKRISEFFKEVVKIDDSNFFGLIHAPLHFLSIFLEYQRQDGRPQYRKQKERRQMKPKKGRVAWTAAQR